MSSIAIVGGGLAGVTAAWQLHRLGHRDVTLYEASGRLGGTLETVHSNGFTIELGPDGWVTDKPWASELARDLGLGDELIPSNDATRVTWILRDGRLQAIPDGMRMMVPTDLDALHASPLFSRGALEAYAAEPGRAAELVQNAPLRDESVASFVERHFGREALETLGAPLLSGVFGGDVNTLSVRAVMPAFVEMERRHGSLITALQLAKIARGDRPAQPIFTSLRSGVGTLVERMVAELPAGSIVTNCAIEKCQFVGQKWALATKMARLKTIKKTSTDHVILATPAHVTGGLLGDEFVKSHLNLEESSAVLVAYVFRQTFNLPSGFGFLVPQGEENLLLAGTFVDQKYEGRVPKGGRLLRAFFGSRHTPHIVDLTDEEMAALALRELRKILPQLPEPVHHIVRRWPRSLPQYAVGHLERMAELDAYVATKPGLHLLGNAYRGVGIPDLIRDARALARTLYG